jgi:hypothetical protein
METTMFVAQTNGAPIAASGDVADTASPGSPGDAPLDGADGDGDAPDSALRPVTAEEIWDFIARGITAGS